MKLSEFYYRSFIVSAVYIFILLVFFATFTDDQFSSTSLKWQFVANILCNIGLLLAFYSLYIGVSRAHLTSSRYKWFLGGNIILLTINSLIVVSYNGDGNGIGLFVILLLQQLYYLVYISMMMYYGVEQESDILPI